MIRENVKRLLRELPEGVALEAAAKSRAPGEILEAVEAGVEIIGENYVQEAEKAFKVIGNKVKWHFIGHLQGNKVNKAVNIFDMIETVDCIDMAKDIEKAASNINKIVHVLVEVNSGREKQKFGAMPEAVEGLVRGIAGLRNIKLTGLMTMGPITGDPENARPYFKETKKIFEDMKAKAIENVEMKYLSMGMSDSYRVAIEEGANIVRLGSAIFGKRN